MSQHFKIHSFNMGNNLLKFICLIHMCIFTNLFAIDEAFFDRIGVATQSLSRRPTCFIMYAESDYDVKFATKVTDILKRAGLAVTFARNGDDNGLPAGGIWMFI